MQSSIITGADSYKFSHFYQDPPGTTIKQSHITARNNKTFLSNWTDKVTFFGLQAWIQERLSQPLTMWDVNFAESFAAAHGVPFNRQGWETIVHRHHGFLPVRIWSLPEGKQVPIGVAQVVVENTDPEFAWLPSYLETEMLRAVWYPSTVATVSRTVKKIIYTYLEQTSDDPDGQIAFKLHDFGQRGATSRQSAGLGGMAHLINFQGTDTTEGILAAMEFYRADVCGTSIPAMEHSTVTAWGRANERKAYANMLEKTPGPILACVSDSYDIYNACKEIWGNQLRKAVIDSGKMVVVRPDSGDPVQIPLDVVVVLAEKFGTTTNSKGFKVLNNVRVIQGDGVDPQKIEKICAGMAARGFSIDNIAFGMGAGLLQNVSRDTFGYAMKTNYAKIDEQDVDIYKDPVTDHRKASWKGRIDVVYSNGTLINVNQKIDRTGDSVLQFRYDNGKQYNFTRFTTIRQQAAL